jgi:hypothetical protein
MFGRKLRYLGMALSLAALLGFAAEASAAQPRAARAPARQAGVLEWAWDWVIGWFGGPGQALRADASCGIDPDGRCASVSGDASGGIDPNGRPASVSGDIGPGLDPDGRH